jgi:thiamine biosynthesis protein ThiS
MMIRVNGKRRNWYERMTIADLLKDLDDSHHYAVVRINDKQVSRPYFEKTQIPDHSEVFLVPMIAGG